MSEMRLDSSSPPDLGMSMWTPSQACEFDQFAEAVTPVEILSGADGDVDGVGDARHGFGIFGRDRIFQPHGLDVLERLGQLDDVARVIAPVALDGEVDVGTEFLAHGVHARSRCGGCPCS